MGRMPRRGEAGFSLVELLVVIIILGILATLSVVVYLNQREVAARASAKQTVRNVSILAETMRQEGDPFPSDLQEYRDESSAYTYLPGTDASADPTQVSIFVQDPDGEFVVLASRSREACLYMRVDHRGQREQHLAELSATVSCRGTEFETGAGNGWD